jgi:eukaryotic-like serine/threonine-protein kinase
MHPEDWGQVEAIFDEALRLAPSEREAFVRAECGSDDALYSDIMPLLRSHGERSLLDESAGNLVASWLLGNVPAPRTGEQIGPYEILAEIGQGGMGAVYRAKDTRLHRDVALKFVRDVDPDDSERFRSFEQEAHAASGLNHPNVVTVYDMGRRTGCGLSRVNSWTE